MFLSDIKYIVFQILVQDVPGLVRITTHSSDAQTLPLTQGVKHQPVMLPDQMLFNRAYVAG